MEGQAAEVIARALNNGQWLLHQADRDMVATFMAFQFLRGPSRRRHMEQTAALVRQRARSEQVVRDRVVDWAKRVPGLDIDEGTAKRDLAAGEPARRATHHDDCAGACPTGARRRTCRREALLAGAIQCVRDPGVMV